MFQRLQRTFVYICDVDVVQLATEVNSRKNPSQVPVPCCTATRQTWIALQVKLRPCNRNATKMDQDHPRRHDSMIQVAFGAFCREHLLVSSRFEPNDPIRIFHYGAVRGLCCNMSRVTGLTCTISDLYHLDLSWTVHQVRMKFEEVEDVPQARTLTWCPRIGTAENFLDFERHQ